MKRPPNLLAIGCALYLLLEVWLLASQPSATVAIRFAITVTLFFFVLRGSRAAGIVWAICNLLAGLFSGYIVITYASSHPSFAGWFALAGVVAFANSAYLIFNPSVRSFQAKPVAAFPHDER